MYLQKSCKIPAQLFKGGYKPEGNLVKKALLARNLLRNCRSWGSSRPLHQGQAQTSCLFAHSGALASPLGIDLGAHVAKWSCTRGLRIMFRAFSQSVSVVCISRSAALQMGFQPLMQPSWHDRGHTCVA